MAKKSYGVGAFSISIIELMLGLKSTTFTIIEPAEKVPPVFPVIILESDAHFIVPIAFSGAKSHTKRYPFSISPYWFALKVPRIASAPVYSVPAVAITLYLPYKR